MNGNRAILLTLVLLGLTVAVFEATSLDLIVQDRIYDAAHGWRVDGNAALPKLIFYDLPRPILGVIGAFLLLPLAVSPLRTARFPVSRREAAFLLLCLSLVPFTIGTLKHATGVFGPNKLARYSGEQPYRSLFQSIPYVSGRPRGHGYPAGHCSGGFALMGLYFVGKRRATRRLGLCVGLAAGWMVGTYQILKGAHFLSHTITTMILAWLIVQLLARAFRLDGRLHEGNAASADEAVADSE